MADTTVASLELLRSPPAGEIRGSVIASRGCFMSGESLQRNGAPSSFRTAENRSENFRSERRRKFFRTIAKHAFPRQTAYELRKLTKQRYGERTIYDWIAGRTDAPVDVCFQIINEILTK